jgi:iron(III) transport system substrate-binding protein
MRWQGDKKGLWEEIRMTLNIERRRLARLGACAALAAGIGALAAPARAQGQLVLYCAVNEEWCRAAVTAFERDTGIKVAMTRKSSGEVYAQIKAEAANPRGDVWWGGSGDPHMQAAEEGLTLEYKSPNMSALQDWAVRQWEQSKNRAVGIYSGALGFGYNTKELAAKKLSEPKCWADLLDAKLRDEVQVADPNSSGTAYTLLATVVQLMGEDKGFDYLKALHKNINQYTKSGAAPAKATALGETAVGITFMHDMITMVVDGAPVKVVAPCEGTGYEIGSMSIIKGARNLDNAKKWYDWALTPAAQALGGETKQYQVPANKNTTVPPQAPKLQDIKLINFDFAKYGSSEERRRLLSKWDKDVKGLPK